MHLLATNIFSRIKSYRQLSAEIETILSVQPDQVQKFQELFNLTVDRIYQDITNFEKENIEKFETEVYRVKKIFVKRYRPHFLYGEYIKWVFDKPYGYAGDFQIIDHIYQNKVNTNGFNGLWDSWFQHLAASISVRQRKEDFKKSIIDFTIEHPSKNLRIMNLGCGPCREIKELLESDATNGIFKNTIFDCYDYDLRAIAYARQLLDTHKNVNFLQKNAIRIALKEKIEDLIPYKYDFIYSTGLFDYLGEKPAVRLVANLNKLLKAGGAIMISNALDKYSTPSPIWMEWIGEWYLIYRAEDEFRDIFINGGFSRQHIQIIPQHNRVMQYAIVRK